MDTEKKPDEKPKQDIGEVVSDLIVSGATVLAAFSGRGHR
jgi:hypothetical protein